MTQRNNLGRSAAILLAATLLAGMTAAPASTATALTRDDVACKAIAFDARSAPALFSSTAAPADAEEPNLLQVDACFKPRGRGGGSPPGEGTTPEQECVEASAQASSSDESLGASMAYDPGGLCALARALAEFLADGAEWENSTVECQMLIDIPMQCTMVWSGAGATDSRECGMEVAGEFYCYTLFGSALGMAFVLGGELSGTVFGTPLYCVWEMTPDGWGSCTDGGQDVVPARPGTPNCGFTKATSIAWSVIPALATTDCN